MPLYIASPASLKTLTTQTSLYTLKVASRVPPLYERSLPPAMTTHPLGTLTVPLTPLALFGAWMPFHHTLTTLLLALTLASTVGPHFLLLFGKALDSLQKAAQILKKAPSNLKKLDFILINLPRVSPCFCGVLFPLSNPCPNSGHSLYNTLRQKRASFSKIPKNSTFQDYLGKIAFRGNFALEL